MGRPVVHWELWSEDPAKVSDFYAKVFDWDVRHIPEMNYRLVETGGEGGINGGLPDTGVIFQGQPQHLRTIGGQQYIPVIELLEGIGNALSHVVRPFHKILRPALPTATAIIPFFLVSLVVLLLVAFIPQISLFIPNLIH